MKQIGLALHQYHSAYDVFPPAGSVDLMGNSGGSGRVPQTASIHLRLTNYLEQRAVYDAYNFALGDVLNGSCRPGEHDGHVDGDPRLPLPVGPQPRQHREPRGGLQRPGHHGQLRGQRRRQSPEHRRLHQRHGLVARRQPVLTAAWSASRASPTGPATRPRSASGSRGCPGRILPD